MAKVQELKLIFFRQTVWGKHPKAIYKCACGVQKELFIANVISGSTKSCGCSTNKTHGMSSTPLFDVWIGIRGRCNNPNNESYHNYGAIGVTVCKEWDENFEPFMKWAIDNGWLKGMEIDKDIKGGKIYSPENCLIVTKKENSNNRRDNNFIEYGGKTKTVQQWSEHVGIHHSLLWARLFRLKWTVEKSLTQKVRNSKKYAKSRTTVV